MLCRCLRNKQTSITVLRKMDQQNANPYTTKKSQEISEKICIDPRPEKAVTDYFATKFGEPFVKKKPVWDVPRQTPATELIAARRELAIAEVALKKKREEEAERRKDLDSQWEDLRRKQLDLRESFIKFDRFVRENENKRERAMRIIQEEKEIQKKQETEIAELTEEVEHLKKIKDELTKNVEEYKIYEEFLWKVVEASEDPTLKTPHDVLNRYETLASARAELAERQEADLKNLEKAKADMIKLTEEKSRVMTKLNNQLADLQIRYEKAKMKTLKWETAENKIKKICAEKAQELDQVKVSCWNLYTAMCIRKGIDITIKEDNIEEQLVFIKRSISDLKSINKMVKIKAAKEVPSSRPDNTTKLAG